MLGVLEADVLPGLAAVDRPVDAVAVGDAALAVVLAGADPDRERVLRVERDAADRVRALAVEDRRPGRARVGRLPDAARGDRDVPDRVVPRVDGDVADAPGGHRRPDAAEREPGEGLGLELRRVVRVGRPGCCPRLVAWLVLGHGSGQGQRERDGEQGCSRQDETLVAHARTSGPKCFRGGWLHAFC